MSNANSSTDSAQENQQETKNGIANCIKDRVDKLRNYARAYLVLTFVLLGGAVVAIIFTNLLSQKDIGTSLALAKTADPGPAPGPAMTHFEDVAICGPPSEETAVAVGSDGVILISADEGKSWAAPDSRTRQDLYSIAFSGSDETAIAVGDGGAILVSTDCGEAWHLSESNSRKRFNEVALSLDGNTAIAVGDDGLIRVSADGGKTWANPDNVTPKDINGVALSGNGMIAVAVGDDKVVRVSSDGGRSWGTTSVSAGDAKDDYEAVALSGDADMTAVAVGDDGAILVSTGLGTSRGAPWVPRGSGDARGDFRAVAFSGDGGTAIAVGRRGVIWASTDGGKNWGSRTSNVGDHLEAIALSDDGAIAVAVGRDGTTLVSIDQGATWHNRDSRTANGLYAVALGGGARLAIMAGENDTVLRSKSSTREVFPEIEAAPEMGRKREGQRKESRSEKTDDEESSQRAGNCRDGTVDCSQGGLWNNPFFQSLLQINILRLEIILVLFFMVQYLISLTRYNLQLAAFYDARRDVILLAPEETLPRPANVEEFERMVNALSPDGLDFGRSPKTVVDQAIRMARFIVRGRTGHETKKKQSRD